MVMFVKACLYHVILVKADPFCLSSSSCAILMMYYNVTCCFVLLVWNAFAAT